MKGTHRHIVIARLALLLVITALLASFNPQTQAAPNPPTDVALQLVAKRTQLPLSDLTIEQQSTAIYQLIGETVTSFKVRSKRSNELFGVTVGADGNERDATDLQRRERDAFTKRFGTIHPDLLAQSASVRSTDKLPVIIWLKEPAYTPPERPAPGSAEARNLAASPAALEQFSEKVESQRAVAVRTVVNPVVARMASLGHKTSAETYSPAIYAQLSPLELQQIAAWREIDQIYPDTINQPELNVARVVVGANVVNSRGFTGSGIQIGQIEVGGRVATANPHLAGVTQDGSFVCGTASSHSTGVAGIMVSTDASSRGIAPGAQLWAGGSCGGVSSELQSSSTAAVNWGARALNLSWGSNTNRVLGANDRFYDDMVINRFVTVIKSAGNQSGPCGDGSGNVTSPGLAYNVIAVGNFDDRNTTGWADDVMDSCSSWNDPVSTNNDREKPEVSAPGANISSTTTSSPWIGGIGSGTSFAAPMVTGGAALLFQRNSSLRVWPEGVKAILLATAVHNIEGNARQSEFDGAGGIALDRADSVADTSSTAGGNWGAQGYSCSTASPLALTTTMYLTAGTQTRAAIAWDNDPAYADYNNRPSADLDMQVIDPNGNVVAGSSTWDNTHEIALFTPSLTGNYTLRVNKFRCDASPRYLGWAWYQGT